MWLNVQNANRHSWLQSAKLLFWVKIPLLTAYWRCQFFLARRLPYDPLERLYVHKHHEISRAGKKGLTQPLLQDKDTIMLNKLLAATLLFSHCATLLAGEIQGYVTDEQGTGLKGVRVCLSVPGAAPGDCKKSHFTNKNGRYSFRGLDAGEPYILKVLSGSSLKARKADPYPNYAWAPVSHEAVLASRPDKIVGLDFTGSFNFSNFQAEFQLSSADFPELAGYDLANDYVFLKLFTVDSSSAEQNLIFLGQVSDINKLLVEVSVPLSATQLFYEIYSATVPDPVTGSISLGNYG